MRDEVTNPAIHLRTDDYTNPQARAIAECDCGKFHYHIWFWLNDEAPDMPRTRGHKAGEHHGVLFKRNHLKGEIARVHHFSIVTPTSIAALPNRDRVAAEFLTRYTTNGDGLDAIDRERERIDRRARAAEAKATAEQEARALARSRSTWFSLSPCCR